MVTIHKYDIVLNNEERQRLTFLSRSRTATFQSVLMAKVVLLAERGASASEINRRTGLRRQSVPLWIKNYNKEKVAGARQGKLRESTTKKRQIVLEIIQSGPKTFGISDELWSLTSIATAFQQRTGQALSKSTVSDLIKAVGFSLRAERANKIQEGNFLTDSERRELRLIVNTWSNSHYKVMRAKIILLADAGMPSKEISSKIDIHYNAVKKWRRRFIRYRMPGLQGKSLPGHLSRREQVEQKKRNLIAILHERPKNFGINRSSWSLAALSRAYQQRHGETVSISTIGELTKKSGYAFKRAKRVLTSPDPNYREKVELLLKTLQNLGENELLFFIDEMGPMQVKKYGGRTLLRKGDSATFPQIQDKKGSITMSAALSATKNQVTWLFSRAKDTRAMIDLIEILFCQNHFARKIYVTWDAASWHRSSELLDWLDAFNRETECRGEGPSIHLVPLPTSSQFLDVLEAVFSGLKRAVIHHSDYRDKVEMKQAISQHFFDRNEHFRNNPKRAGKKIWEIDFFDDPENIRGGNYREW